MRTRLFVISSLAVAALVGAANSAAATPQGPGDIKSPPKQPTTTTTQAPKGPDKLAPKPTTTIPPKGPDDIAPAPADENPPVEPGPDTTGNGSGSDNYVPPADKSGADSVVGGVSVDNAEPAAQESTEVAAEETDGEGGFNPLLIIVAAAIVGALLALAATRLRRA